MIRAMATAALLLSAPGAWAEPAWYAAATAGWEEGIQRTDAFDWVKFKDENGTDRTLFVRTAQVPRRTSDSVQEADIPLYELEAPRVEKRTMKVPVSLFPERVEEAVVDLVIFEKGKVSTYYVKGVDTFHYTIGRRDRPETVLKNTWIASHWDLGSGLISRTENVNGLVFYGRAQVYKPEGIAPAAVSPLTAGIEVNDCRDIEKFWREPKPDAWAQIYRGWLPQEFELWEVPLDPALSTPGIWTPLYQEAQRQIAENGSFERAAQYHDWFRATAAGAVERALKASSSGPDDRLTPGESRFVLCRMRRAGPDAEAAFAGKAAGARDAGRFTAFWRRFMAQELSAYQAEVKSVPRLPRLPDHASSDATLLSRTRAALAGRLVTPVSPAPVAPPPSPRRSPIDDGRLEPGNDPFGGELK